MRSVAGPAGRTTAREAVAAALPRHAAAVVPAVLVAASGVLLFGLGQPVPGYLALAGALLVAAALGATVLGPATAQGWRGPRWALLRDLSLIALGVVVMSVTPVNTEVTDAHIVRMGSAMVLAVGLPYLVSRHVYRDHAIRFPLRAGRWTRFERVWLVAVVGIGYALLPVYMIRTGVYENWPAVSDAEGVARLFVGTNALGIWDELFFVCTCFTLLRRHLADWQANLVQAALFTSFLHELGFHAWGPYLIFPFALVQGYTFKVTRSLTYIVCVHLLFDLVLFGVLVHAHNRAWLDVFVY